MKRVIIPAIMALSIPAVGFAENQKGQILLNPAASYLYTADELNLDDSVGGGLGIEYRMGSNWAAEISAFVNDAEHAFNSDLDNEISQYRLDGLYYLTSDGGVQPYLGFGVGHADLSAGMDNETQANAGGGLRFNFTDSLSARWDLRALYSMDENLMHAMTTLGLSFAFGGAPSAPAEPVDADSDGDGVMDSVDRCPGTEYGLVIDSTGCAMDSDGDGVPDGRDMCEASPAEATVDATGCPTDEDGDGVFDGIDQCPGSDAGARVDATGCVGITETVAIESIAINVKFASGSDKIPDEYQGEIQKVADFMMQYPDVNAEVEVHSDSQGAAAYNKKLSMQRAQAVKNALVSDFGIDMDRLTAVGYGEERPIADNSTAEGRKLNRRVVAQIQKEVRR